MHTTDLDSKINSFLSRKQAEFPELASQGRLGMRTIKHAQLLRSSGQMIFSR